MSKNIKISLLILFLLFVFIIVKNIDFTSDVPELGSWEGKADEIQLQKNNASKKIVFKDNKWFVGEKLYPANERTVSNIIKKVKDLEIQNLVSDKKFYNRYELTDDKATSVKILKGGKVLRSILIGKMSSTAHTFIRLNEKPQVYLAQGQFGPDFSKSVEELRDKTIFKVSRDAITSLSVKFKGKTLIFDKIKEEIKKIDNKDKKQDKKPSSIKPKKSEKFKWISKEYKNAKVSTQKINNLIGAFNPLLAASFSDVEKKSLKKVITQVKIKAFGKDIILKVYKKEKDNRYIASSSESPYLFMLNEWVVKKYFIKSIKELEEK